MRINSIPIPLPCCERTSPWLDTPALPSREKAISFPTGTVCRVSMKQPPRLILLTTPFMRDPDLSRTCAGISQSRRENTLRSTGLPFSGLPFGWLAFSGLAFAGLPFCTTVVFELGSFNRSCRRVANTLGSCGNASFVGLQRLKRLSQSIQRKGPRKRTRRMTCSMKPRRRDLRTLSLPQKGHTKVAVWFCVPIESCCRKFTTVSRFLRHKATWNLRGRNKRVGDNDAAGVPSPAKNLAYRVTFSDRPESKWKVAQTAWRVISRRRCAQLNKEGKMATAKQRAAARRNIKKAAAARRKRPTGRNKTPQPE